MSGLTDHWRKDSFDTLRHITGLIANGPHADLYADYVRYLELRHQGRRKEALVACDRFVETYSGDPFEIRRRICWHLIQQTEAYWDRWPQVDKWLFPGNIGAKLLAPTFKQWRLAEPTNVHAWLYELEWNFDLEHGAEMAFMLEPHNPRCQYAELASLVRYLDYVLHEFGSVGMLLASREEYGDAVRSLTAVTDAMGNNLHEEVKPVLVWLQALLPVYEANTGDLRPILEAQGAADPPDYPSSAIRRWFREPPLVGGR